jgi:hypothetical protein
MKTRDAWLVAGMTASVCIGAAFSQPRTPVPWEDEQTYLVRAIAGKAWQGDWFLSTHDHLLLFSKVIGFLGETIALAMARPIVSLLNAASLLLAILIGARLVLKDAPPEKRMLHIGLYALLQFGAARFILVGFARRGSNSLADSIAYGTRLDGIGQFGDLFQSWFVPGSIVPLVLLGAVFAATHRRNGVFVGLLILATAIHPGFALPCGFLFVGWWLGFREAAINHGRYALAWLLGTVLVLIPAYLAVGGDSPSVAEAGARIIAFGRIPQMAAIQAWNLPSTLFACLIVAFGIGLMRADPATRKMLAIAAGLAAVATISFSLFGNARLILLLPQRLAELVLPVSLSSVAAAIAGRVEIPRLATIASGCGLLAVAVAWRVQDSARVPIPGPTRGEIGCQEVARALPTGSVILVPPEWASFRWIARHPVFVDVKSHPFRPSEVLEWNERVKIARSALAGSPVSLAEAKRRGATHIIQPRSVQLRKGDVPCGGSILREIY